jgi:hypothetical protein
MELLAVDMRSVVDAEDAKKEAGATRQKEKGRDN